MAVASDVGAPRRRQRHTSKALGKEKVSFGKEGRCFFALLAMWLLGLLVLFAAACGGSGSGATPPATVSTTGNPQVAQYLVSLPPAASAKVQFGTTTQYGLETSSQTAPSGGGLVNILVAGMLANTTYHMRAVVHTADNRLELDSDHTFTTGGPPLARVPVVSVAQTGSLTPSPGIELLDFVPYTSDQFNLLHTVAMDLNGNLIWYYDPPDGAAYPFPVKLLPNGHMLVNLVPLVSQAFTGIREIDLAGNTVNQISLTDLNNELAAAQVPWSAIVIHHDFLTLGNGHLILLVAYSKTFQNLPGFPGDTQVVGDALVDLDADRNVAWTWSSFDHLDVNHHPLNFPDWTHSNALIYSPSDGNLIVSMRDQDWVIKIAYENGHGDGHVIWRLGPGGYFTLQGGTAPTDWNYAQHYPIILSPNSSGTFELGLMDNGNGRVFADGMVCGSPGAPLCYSRAIIFQLDEDALTARLIWQDSPLPYSACCGNIDVVGNGDIEFNLAYTSPVAFVEEVTPRSTPSLVWQMEIPGQLPYRAFRLPSLYPGVQW